MMYRHLGALLRCHVTWRMCLLLRHKHDSQSTRINTRTHGKTRTSLRDGACVWAGLYAGMGRSDGLAKLMPCKNKLGDFTRRAHKYTRISKKYSNTKLVFCIRVLSSGHYSPE
jgi:hypothetical protein